MRIPALYFGVWSILVGLAIYFAAIALSILRLLALRPDLLVDTIAKMLWASGFPTTVGIILITIDLLLFLPSKRRGVRKKLPALSSQPSVTVALTAYNDEPSIFESVRDFSSHPVV